jgi:hypothetical protein
MHVNSHRGEMFRECGSDFRSPVLGTAAVACVGVAIVALFATLDGTVAADRRAASFAGREHATPELGIRPSDEYFRSSSS